jgi:hypothetical protein
MPPDISFCPWRTQVVTSDWSSVQTADFEVKNKTNFEVQRSKYGKPVVFGEEEQREGEDGKFCSS